MKKTSQHENATYNIVRKKNFSIQIWKKSIFELETCYKSLNIQNQIVNALMNKRSCFMFTTEKTPKTVRVFGANLL